jgi:hypothetical protein
MNRLITTIIVILMYCQGAWGATIVAKPDATNPTTSVMYKTGTLANCSDPDASFTTANSRLSNASAAAGTGGTLSICAGTYKGTMLSTTSGTFILYYANQVINGAGAAATYMDGTNSSTYIIDTALTGTITLSNLTIRNAPISGYGFNGRGQPAILTDVVFRNNVSPFVLGGGGTKTMTRVKVMNNPGINYGGGLLIGGTLNSNYCIWENNASPLVVQYSGTILNTNNSLMVGGTTGAVRLASAGIIANISNSIAFANSTDNNTTYPFNVFSGATLNLSNSLILPNGLKSAYLFQSANETKNQYIDPGFLSPRRFGWISLFVDDLGDWPYFKTMADYANSRGIGAVFAADASNRTSAQTFAEYWDYISRGNEIACHTKDHPNLLDLTALSITGRVGSTPTVTIANDQSANSSAAWTGSVTLKEGGLTVKTIPMTITTTLNDLATAIKSQTGWSAAAGSKGAIERAVVLANVIDQSTATIWTAQFDQQHFWYYEIAESKAELEAGIGNGYVVKTFVNPFDKTNATLQEWIANNANFVNAGTTAFTIGRGGSGTNGSYTLSDDATDIANTGANGLRIMKFLEIQTTALQNQPKDIAALTSLLTWMGGYVGILGHNTTEYTQAQWQTLIDTLVATPGLSIVLPRDAGNTIRTSGLWNDTSNSVCTATVTPYSCCTGNGTGTCAGLVYARHFNDAQDYHLRYGSPAINAGSNSPLTGIANVKDYDGVTITDATGAIVASGGIVDIGIFEADGKAPAGSIVINNGASYTNTTSVQLTLSAADPSGVTQMCVSNSMVCSAWEPYVTTKNWTLDVALGTKMVFVWYKDTFGNIDQTPYTASIILGATPVMVSVTTPPNGTYTNNATLGISGTAYSVAGIQGISINSVFIAFDSSGNFTRTVPLSTGANTINTLVFDPAGNQAIDTRTVILDQTPPVITISYPLPNSTIYGQSLMVSGAFDKPATITIQVNSNAPLPASQSGLSFTADVVLDSGLNTILITATDQAGNSSQMSVTVTCDVPLSVTPPPPSVGISVYTLSGTMHPGSTISITPINGTGANTGAVVYTSPTTWSCTVGNLAGGDNVFSIVATSSTGSVTSTTATVNFVPDPTLVPAMNKPVVVILAVVLLLVLRTANVRGARKVSEC